MTIDPAEGVEARFRLSRPVDPWLTLGPLRHGHGDPTTRFEARGVWRATRTPDGPATVFISPDGAAMRVRAWGAVRVLAWGAGRARALDAIPRLLGQEDDAESFRPRDALLVELARRRPGLRFGRTDAVYEALLPAVIEQKVTGVEARRSYRALLRIHGEPAPGPAGLRLPPSPELLASLPYHALHPLGLEQRRADTLRRVAAAAQRLETAGRLPAGDALRVLRSVPGVGAWTAAESARVSFGDPDAVSVGDYHVPSLVCWALAGEPRGDDARMLELLEPYRGQRARAVRLLEAAGIYLPRRGPRMRPRSIAAM